MRHSLTKFIEEHERIEALAAQLLSDSKNVEVPAAQVSDRLAELAATVSSHIADEDEVLIQLDPAKLRVGWHDMWAEGTEQFERLKADWLSFIDDWTGPQIVADRGGFIRAAQDMFSRLNERLQRETSAFYATGLQFGAIALS